jgi:hypothetical protein
MTKRTKFKVAASTKNRISTKGNQTIQKIKNKTDK